MFVPSQVPGLVPCHVVEGILDSDVPQMQGFENKSIFLKDFISQFSHTVFLSAFTCLALLNPKAYLEQTNVLNCARV